MTAQSSSTGTLIRYSLLALPLTFVGLPLYIYLPKFYADTFQVDLALIGVMLLLLRIGDAFIDPWLGKMSDAYQLRRKGYFILGIIAIAISFNSLFWLPNNVSSSMALVWFSCMTGITYLFYSFVAINFYALGLNLAANYQERTRLSAYREGITLVGILMGSALPPTLSSYFSPPVAFKLYGFILLIFAVTVLIIFPAIDTKQSQNVTTESFLKFFREDRRIQWLYGLFFVNALPTAMTSTLYLFYVEYVLEAASLSGLYLLTYFLSAALSTALWNTASEKYSKRSLLIAAIILTIVGFSGAYVLDHGSSSLFFMICIITGVALAGELVVFPSLLADLLENKTQVESSSFGLWQALNKLSLAAAAGFSLPALSLYGFVPGQEATTEAASAIAILYALVPLVLKVFVLLGVLLSPLEKTYKR